MNVVNFSDGIDGLAAGVCAIAAAAFVVIAFDLDRANAAVLAAIIAGAALGFLVHNFHPATVFMGDCGSNLLGLLLACVAVEGTIKTQAVLALVLPLIVLAVPFLDTTFVVLKRLKYRRPVYHADREHFHHRMDRIGFSTRRTVLYLYAWTLMLAGLALALRFVPYSDNGGRLHAGWATVMALLGMLALVASIYLVYVLEILKFKRLDAMRLRRMKPDATEEEIDSDVVERLKTGEFEAVRRETEEFERLGQVEAAGPQPPYTVATQTPASARTSSSSDTPPSWTSIWCSVRSVIHTSANAVASGAGADPAIRPARPGLGGDPRRAGVHEAADERVPERADDLVVGRQLDDRAHQRAVGAVQRGDLAEGDVQLRGAIAGARPPRVRLAVELVGELRRQPHQQLALVGEVEVERRAGDPGALGDPLDAQRRVRGCPLRAGLPSPAARWPRRPGASRWATRVAATGSGLHMRSVRPHRSACGLSRDRPHYRSPRCTSHISMPPRRS